MRGLRLIAPLAAMTALVPGCAGEERAKPSPKPVMMFVGDSFAVGSGPVPRWETYASETARRLGFEPVIAGAGGTGYLNTGRVGRTFQRSFETELAWRPAPDLLVISGGHNDRRWSPARVGDAAARLLKEVRTRWPRTKVVMVGPIWLSGTPRKAYGMRDALAKVAGREGVTFLDPLRHRWPAEAILPDGVHPTLAGHRRLAAWLAGELA
ncbi:SGNH/GDSL hydrolase family protein [Nonomuraea sp. NPDC049400]|uniref:SGNH/GDSL hydrolase family protein n=1 Tax=Nonomuraea sp. NPDC049400 TaxID=3364352 RepID=UPI0037BA8C7F